MAFPFIIGLAIGAGAIIAVDKSKKIKKIVNDGVEVAKDGVKDIKTTIKATSECIKEKKEKIIEEETLKTDKKNNIKTKEDDKKC